MKLIKLPILLLLCAVCFSQTTVTNVNRKMKLVPDVGETSVFIYDVWTNPANFLVTNAPNGMVIGNITNRGIAYIGGGYYREICVTNYTPIAISSNVIKLVYTNEAILGKDNSPARNKPGGRK